MQAQNVSFDHSNGWRGSGAPLNSALLWSIRFEPERSMPHYYAEGGVLLRMDRKNGAKGEEGNGQYVPSPPPSPGPTRPIKAKSRHGKQHEGASLRHTTTVPVHSPIIGRGGNTRGRKRFSTTAPLPPTHFSLESVPTEERANLAATAFPRSLAVVQAKRGERIHIHGPWPAGSRQAEQSRDRAHIHRPHPPHKARELVVAFGRACNDPTSVDLGAPGRWFRSQRLRF
jgi:hypothetical protein